MSPYSITLTLPEKFHPYAETVWPAIAELARADGYHWIAEQIEAQLPKATITEPTEFGSIVRAGFDEYSDRFLWQRGPKGGWTSEDGSYQGFFGALHDPEVLRVGVGPERDWTLLQHLHEVKAAGYVVSLPASTSEVRAAGYRAGVKAERAATGVPVAATPPAEAVEADKVPSYHSIIGHLEQGPCGCAIGRHHHPESTPEQVEAKPACNCGGSFGTNRDQHHPNCDINLPADKRSGIHTEEARPPTRICIHIKGCTLPRGHAAGCVR